MKQPLKAIIVGGGHRSLTYASYAESNPDALEIVGVAEPDDFRRNTIAERFKIKEEHIYKDSDELASAPKFADVVINGTMDHQHVATTLPLLERGYDILLEKPFAVNEEEMRTLLGCAKKYGRKIMVCFVLRYSPFYRKIKELILSGEIGEIINIQTTENVSYHHMTTSHVRGKWKNEDECHTTMLLAKCCHDIDIMMWLMGNDKPVRVSAMGSLMQFRPENAPENAGTQCITDCPLCDTCIYSAKRIYLDHPDRWAFYVWDKLENKENADINDKTELLKTSPYGRCVYKCRNNVVDHESLVVSFQSGATGTHNMTGGAATGKRTVHIIGTKGEIDGTLEDGTVTLLTINPSPGCEYGRTDFQCSESNDSHGGGDMLLVRDFIDYVRNDNPSVSCTSIEDSVKGHLTVFKADESMKENGAVKQISL